MDNPVYEHGLTLNEYLIYFNFTKFRRGFTIFLNRECFKSFLAWKCYLTIR